MFNFLTNNFISGVLTSIVATVIVAIIITLFKLISNSIFNAHRDFSIDGYWLAAFQFEDYSIYEIVKISTHRESIYIKYQSYRVKPEDFIYVVGHGSGKYRSGYIFCPYIDNIFDNQLGTYALRHYILDRRIALAGYFMQTHSESSATGFYQGKIAFVSINLEKIFSLINRLSFVLRFNLGYQVFSDKKEILRFTGNATVRDAIEISQNILQEWENY